MPSHVRIKNTILYEIQLIVPSMLPGADAILRRVLCACGFSQSHIVYTVKDGRVIISVYASRKAQVNTVCARINDARLKGVRLNVRTLGAADWRDRWKSSVRPFRLTQRYDVVPVWHREKYRAMRGRQPVYLDTTLAFGTGLHETTRFMALMIERCHGHFQNFLDIGTGSGILSIFAYLYGAKEVWGIDADALAVETARKNLARNGMAFSCCRHMDFRKFSVKKRFDFIAANIITDELIAVRSAMLRLMAPGGFLALSGISMDNLSRLKKAFQIRSLRCVKIYRGKKWAGILYRHKER